MNYFLLRPLFDDSFSVVAATTFELPRMKFGFQKVVAILGYYSKKRPRTDRQPLFDDTKPKKNPEWEKLLDFFPKKGVLLRKKTESWMEI
jgi:hypothetical protein